MSICCEIVTQSKIVYDGGADMVILPGVNGVMGILPHHAPLLSLLKTGIITVTINNKTLIFSVKGGIVEVQPDQVTVLADRADDVRNINLSELDSEINRFEELLEQTEITDQKAIKNLHEMKEYSEVKLRALTIYQSTTVEMERQGE